MLSKPTSISRRAKSPTSYSYCCLIILKFKGTLVESPVSATFTSTLLHLGGKYCTFHSLHVFDNLGTWHHSQSNQPWL